MKFLLRFVILILALYYVPTFFPWWVLFPIAFLVGYFIPGPGLNVFNSGFLSGGIVWLVYSFILDQKTDQILSLKIVQLFPVTDSSMLIILAGVIGGLCAGFATLSGSSFRELFQKKKSKGFYS